MHYNTRFCKTDRSEAKLSIVEKIRNEKSLGQARKKIVKWKSPRTDNRGPNENSYIFHTDMRKLWHYKRVIARIYYSLFSRKEKKHNKSVIRKKGSKRNTNKALIQAIMRDLSPLINTVANLPFLCRKLCTGKLKREFIKLSLNLKIGQVYPLNLIRQFSLWTL